MLDSLISPDQIPYEESLLKNSDDEILWLEYAEAFSTNFEKSRFILERATTHLPASTLLWNTYFLLPWAAENTRHLIELYERAVRVLYDTPGFWHKYVDLLLKEGSENGRAQAKTALDRALLSLHGSQHGALWKKYLNLAETSDRKLSAVIYARFFEVAGSDIADLPDLSKEQCVLKVAELGDHKKAIELYQLLNKDKNRVLVLYAEFRLDLLRAVLADPHFEADRFVQTLVQESARDSPEWALKLYLELAAYYTARKNLDSARHFHTLAFSHADSVLGVVAVFSAVSNWEENQAERLYSKAQDEIHKTDTNANGHKSEIHSFPLSELKFRLKLFKHLLDQQPILINDVLLQKNPNCIDHWLERVEIYSQSGNVSESINTYVTAIRRINPLKATLKKGHTMAGLWIAYAERYVSQGDLSTANVIYSHAVRSQYKAVKELADLYIAWTEMIFSVSDEEALQHIELVLFAAPEKAGGNDTKAENDEDSKPSIHDQLHTCGDLWAFYIDVLKSMVEEGEDNLEIYQKLGRAYNHLLLLQIISLRSLLDYADFMDLHGGLKKTYEVYEKGLENFRSPQAQFHIWIVYIAKTVQNEKNADTVRSLFDRCLTSGLPGFQIYEIYEKNCAFETQNGNLVQTVKLMRDAIGYLSRTYSSPRYTKTNRNKIADDKFTLYTKVGHVIRHSLADESLYRTVMSEAMQDPHLTLPSVIQLGFEYIEFEKTAKEHHRVRALFKYLAGLGHPDTHVVKDVWRKWEEWEVEYGTEVSYKQLLKTRRQIANEFKGVSDLKADINPMGFVIGESKKEPIAEVKEATKNPDVIELDMDM